ncbi:MAG TPA: hypothetical protein VFL14_08995 [Xanthomonadales bacterium]|nr:hypothetical protein [Xanthomonadales bacterium]
MIGFPATTVREALVSLAYRVVLSIVALLLAADAWHAPAPGVPKESNYRLVLVSFAALWWCASAAWTLVRVAWWPPARAVSQDDGD